MHSWPRHPLIYEINTWIWLDEMSRQYQRPLTLATLPAAEWDRIAAAGFDAVWLMGVWERSPAGIAIALSNPGLVADFHRSLPDFTPSDNVGSPYCVRSYSVDPHLGGPTGLAHARAMLRERGIRLILDFVPNHVAPDHPWVRDHPDYFIRGSRDDARQDPSSFVEIDDQVFARGRDPHYPAWHDVLQLNAFHPGLRQATIDTLDHIAAQCDGIRCDMAMLLLDPIFHRTWSARAGDPPAERYWSHLIASTRARWPDFKFIAEAYWDTEWELQQQGFDHCYDKKLYDRMEHGDSEGIRQHLQADLAYQHRMLRFIENHDEARAATTFTDGMHRAAAVMLLTLPGAKLLHEGQLEGRKIRPSVFLARRPPEPIDTDLADFYQRLLAATRCDVFRNGHWTLCHPQGWPDNSSYQHIVCSCWTLGEDRYLAVVNFHPHPAQAHVQLPWDELRGKPWRLADTLSHESHLRAGDTLRDEGLHLELQPWQAQLFHLQPQ